MSEFDEEPTEAELAKPDKIDITVLDLADRADALLRISARKGSEPDDQAEPLTYADAAVSPNRKPSAPAKYYRERDPYISLSPRHRQSAEVFKN